MHSRIVLAALIMVGAAVIGTSAWMIDEVGKNNRHMSQLNQALTALSENLHTVDADRKREIAVLNARIDRLLPGTVNHEHSDVRRFVIAGHLARAVSPVVVFGDSIVEAAVLPTAVCGHTIVNAGIGGTGVDGLLDVAPSLLDGKSPALVVVAIGTNDAYSTPGREKLFTASYGRLLQSLAPISPKLAVASIPPVDPKGALTVAAGLDAGLIDRYNQILPKLAEAAGASFVDLNKAVSAEGRTETLDGVHLAPSAYALWDAAMLQGIKSALNCLMAN